MVSVTHPYCDFIRVYICLLANLPWLLSSMALVSRMSARRNPSLHVKIAVDRSWKCTVGTPNSSGVSRRATMTLTINGSNLDAACVTANGDVG